MSFLATAKIGVKYDIFPNPAKECIYVVSEENISSAKISLYDAIGTPLQINALSLLDEHKIKIDTSNLNPGIYFLRITVGDQAKLQRIVIE